MAVSGKGSIKHSYSIERRLNVGDVVAVRGIEWFNSLEEIGKDSRGYSYRRVSDSYITNFTETMTPFCGKLVRVIDVQDEDDEIVHPEYRMEIIGENVKDLEGDYIDSYMFTNEMLEEA